MSISKAILVLLGLFMGLFVQAQNADDEIDPMPVKLRGRVLNIDDGSPVPFAYLVNMRTHMGTTTNTEGYFSMEMLNIDSLSLTIMGYQKMSIKIDPKYNENELFIIHALPVHFPIGEVKVKGERAKVDLGLPQGKSINITPELRGDAFNSKPPVIAALVSPLSFVQYYASRREKEKRAVRKAIVSESHWQSVSKYYTKEKVMELTGLNDHQAEAFMIYFNSKGILNQASTEYDVRAAILEQYSLYMQRTPE